MLSEYITSLADVSFHIVAYMYAWFRYSGKNPMRFAVFGVFLCGFAVFGPPLRPPPFLVYQTDLVNLKQLSLSGSVNSARYMPRRFASQYIYPPLFTSPSGDSCILLTYQLALR